MRKGFATVFLPAWAIDRLRAIASATALPGTRPNAAAAARSIIDAAEQDAVCVATNVIPRSGANITLPAGYIRKLQTIAQRTAGDAVTIAALLAALIAEAPVPRKRAVRKPSAKALAALSLAHRAAYLARMETPQPTYAEIARRGIPGLNSEPAVKYAAERAIKLLHG